MTTRVLFYDMYTLRSGLIRNWDDDSASTDGTIVGATPYSEGRPPGSYAFAGSGYVAIPAFALAGTVLTFSAWVRCILDDEVTQGFIGDGSSSSTVGYIFLFRELNTHNLTWGYADGAAAQSAEAAYFFDGHNDTWVHVAVICDYAAKTCKFYRNGVLYSTVAMTGTPVFPSTSRIRYLGAYDTTPSCPLTDGYIDEVKLYEGAYCCPARLIRTNERSVTQLD